LSGVARRSTSHRGTPLTPVEVWGIQGGDIDEWVQALRAGVTDEALLELAARALPPQSAGAVVGAVAGASSTWGWDDRVGVCLHPEDVEEERRLYAWLRAWKQSPEDPDSVLPKEARKRLPKLPAPLPIASFEDDPDRCGGPKISRREDLLRSLHLRRTTAHGPETWLSQPENRGLAATHRGLDLASEREKAVAAAFAPGTQTTYKYSWGKWETFCRAREEQPLITGSNPQEEWDDEERVLDFVVHVTVNMHREAGTLKGYLSAIGSRHEQLGLGRPLDRMRRVWLSLKGLRRTKGGTKRKHPVTSGMLRRIR